jgi:hypothetical protein
MSPRPSTNSFATLRPSHQLAIWSGYIAAHKTRNHSRCLPAVAQQRLSLSVIMSQYANIQPTDFPILGLYFIQIYITYKYTHIRMRLCVRKSGKVNVFIVHGYFTYKKRRRLQSIVYFLKLIVKWSDVNTPAHKIKNLAFERK